MVIVGMQNGCMAKKKATATPDRHKPAGFIRLPLSMIEQLDKLVEANATDRSEEVRNAVREYLKARDLWPPK
jgi:hypothetical protein